MAQPFRSYLGLQRSETSPPPIRLNCDAHMATRSSRRSRRQKTRSRARPSAAPAPPERVGAAAPMRAWTGGPVRTPAWAPPSSSASVSSCSSAASCSSGVAASSERAESASESVRRTEVARCDQHRSDQEPGELRHAKGPPVPVLGSRSSRMSPAGHRPAAVTLPMVGKLTG